MEGRIARRMSASAAAAALAFALAAAPAAPAAARTASPKRRPTAQLPLPRPGDESVFVYRFRYRGKLPKVGVLNAAALPRTLTLISSVRRDPRGAGRGLALLALLNHAGASASSTAGRNGHAANTSCNPNHLCLAAVLGVCTTDLVTGQLVCPGGPLIGNSKNSSQVTQATQAVQAHNVAQYSQPNYGGSSRPPRSLLSTCSPGASPTSTHLLGFFLSGSGATTSFGSLFGGFTATSLLSFAVHDTCAKTYPQLSAFHGSLGFGPGGGAGGGILSAIACPSTSLCVAGDSDGSVVTSTAPSGAAAGWHASKIDGTAGILTLVCPSITLCVGGDTAGNALDSTNPEVNWGMTVVNGTPNKIYGASCVPGLCALGDDSGSVITAANPTSGPWTVAKVDHTGHSVDAVACQSTSLCVAVDAGGNAIASPSPTGGAGTWTTTNIDGGNFMWGVACPAANLCVAVDGVGGVLTTTKPVGGTWSHYFVDGSNSIFGVSCPSTGFCAAVDNHGQILTTTDPASGTWSATDADGATPLYAVSCPTSGFCAATDAKGNVLTSTSPVSGPWTVTHVDDNPTVSPPPYH